MEAIEIIKLEIQRRINCLKEEDKCSSFGESLGISITIKELKSLLEFIDIKLSAKEKTITITQEILDYITERRRLYELELPQLGEVWTVTGEYSFPNCLNGEPLVEVEKDNKWMQLPKSILTIIEQINNNPTDIELDIQASKIYPKWEKKEIPQVDHFGETIVGVQRDAYIKGFKTARKQVPEWQIMTPAITNWEIVGDELRHGGYYIKLEELWKLPKCI